MHNVASAYGVRPSEIVGLGEPLAAWAFDEATLMVGRHVEAAVRDGRSVARALADYGRKKGRGGGEYRSVRGLGKVRRMKVPESGVW